jgi:hypothetical protein
MELHRFGLQTEHAAGRAVIDGLHLRAAPDLRRLAVITDNAVHRLHRRVREVWELKISFDDFDRRLEAGFDVAVFACG